MANIMNILLVEDNPADARLIEEILKDTDTKNEIYVVKDGVEAMNFLNKKDEYSNTPEPVMILLDLNLPRKDGREVLKEIKHNEQLKHIPIVILTTSSAKDDIMKTYDNYANCYITKPVDFDQFSRVIAAIEDFWFKIVELP